MTDQPHPDQPLRPEGRPAGVGPSPYGAAHYGAPHGTSPYGGAQDSAAQHGAAPYGASQHGAPVPAQQPGSGLAIAALVLGIAALVLAFFPFVGLLSVLLGAAAIVCGILAMRRRQSKGMSIAGIVTGALGLVGSILVTLAAAALMAALEESTSAFSSIGASSSAAASPPGVLGGTSDPSATHDVELIGSVDGGSATMSYSVGGSSSSEDITADTLSVTGRATTGEPLVVTVMKDFTVEGETTVSCEIVVDGTSVAQETGNTSATCSAGYGDY